jgi:integrase/recombinase XerD
MSEPIAVESKALKIRPVKRLFEYLVSTHKLLINPTEGIIETIRRRKKIGPVLTVSEIKKLFEQPNLSLRTGIRDRAIMELLYSTGIRAKEFYRLEIYHVDLKDKVLHIKGKGRKHRMVPMGTNAAKYLKEYLEKIRPYYAKKNPKERRLFLLNNGFCVNPASVRVMLRKYRDMAKIKKSASPHTFRRTCATHFMHQGADIRYIQKLLGHKRLSTTQAYTRVMQKDVKETHEKTHPGIEIRNSRSEIRNKKG